MKKQRERRLLLINDSIAAGFITEGKAATNAAEIISQDGQTQSLTARGLLLCGLLSPAAAGFSEFTLYEIGRRCGAAGGYRSSQHRAGLIAELETLQGLELKFTDRGGREYQYTLLDYEITAGGQFLVKENGFDKLQAACGGGVYISCEALTGYKLTERAARVLLWAVQKCKLTAASKADYITASKSEFYSFCGADNKMLKARAKGQLQTIFEAIRLQGNFLNYEIELERGNSKRFLFRKRAKKGTKRAQKGDFNTMH